MKTLIGAEARVKISDEDVEKIRKEKKYRHNKLDSRLREERTETEIRILEEGETYGLNVPKVIKKGKSSFKMEKIDGEPLKNVLKKQREALRKTGEEIARLHQIDIIHGDLTTNNILIKEDKVFLIDFGLSFRSERIEDKAVDIHLLKQVLKSSHANISKDKWTNFIQGYNDYSKSEDVLEKLKEVETRGRYK